MYTENEKVCTLIVWCILKVKILLLIVNYEIVTTHVATSETQLQWITRLVQRVETVFAIIPVIQRLVKLYPYHD